mgnify:CR=1 FL=1
MDSINIDMDMDFSNIKNKELDTEISNSDKNICQGIKKDKTNCTKNGVVAFENKFFCKVHFKQQSKDPETKEKKITKKDKNEVNIDTCEGIKKDKKRCTKKGTKIYNNCRYCSIHFKQQSKVDTDEETKYDADEETKYDAETKSLFEDDPDEETKSLIEESKCDPDEEESKYDADAKYDSDSKYDADDEVKIESKLKVKRKLKVKVNYDTEDDSDSKLKVKSKSKSNINSKDEDIIKKNICESIKKDGDRCTKNGIDLIKGKYYCKTHSNKLQKILPNQMD